ncbi:hypothetical protein RI054_30g120990 [Pseudoscourfieldia marina]
MPARLRAREHGRDELGRGGDGGLARGVCIVNCAWFVCFGVRGKQLSNVATGFTVHMHPLEAAEAEYGRTARLRDAPRVILRCLASGRGWKRGRSLSFPLLTPIALLGEQSDEPPPADFRPRRTVGARTTGVPHLRR